MDKKMNEEKKKPFSERHPYANSVIALGVLAIMCVIAFVVLRWFFIGVKNSAVQVWQTFSKMDAVVVVAVITGGFSILAVCISTVIGKLIEAKQSKREYLTKQRELPYEDFVKMIYRIQMSTKEGYEYSEQEMLEDISKVSKQITLWGSNRVVNKWVEFRENATNTDYAVKNLFVLEGIMNDMRKDLGVKKVKKGNLLSFFVNDVKETLNSN